MNKTKSFKSVNRQIIGIAIAFVLVMTLCFALMTIKSGKVYAVDYEVIKEVRLTMELPECGTVVKLDGEPASQDWANDDVKQTPSPSVKVITKEAYLAIEDENVQQYWDEVDQRAYAPCFVNSERPMLLDYKKKDLFEGEITKGSDVWLKVPLYPKDGYMFEYDRESELTDDGYTTNMKAYVNGKPAIMRVPSGPGIVLFKIEASDLKHDWDAGKVTTQPTASKEGVKTFTCKGCGETKTEAIPKKSSSAAKKPLMAKLSAGSNSITFAWNKVKGADGYDIYLCRCDYGDKKFTAKKVKTIKGAKTKWTKKGLKKHTPYKGYVKAFKMVNGKKKYIDRSVFCHEYTSGGTKKFTNAKSVTVNKTKVTLKKGKTFKIKAKVVKENSKKKLMPAFHAPAVRYKSSNSKVAKVSSSGKVTAKGKGTCSIYAYAHNGVQKVVKVTVK